MRPHHTKDKGDVGVARTIADLADQGFVVLTALCEHAPFDLVAYRDGMFVPRSGEVSDPGVQRRDQGQLRELMVGLERHIHTVPSTRTRSTSCCIYCPDTRCVLLRRPEGLRDPGIAESPTERKRSARNVLVAEHYSSHSLSTV